MIDSNSFNIPYEKRDRMSSGMWDFVRNVIDNKIEFSDPKLKKETETLVDTFLKTNSAQKTITSGYEILDTMRKVGFLDPDRFDKEMKDYVELSHKGRGIIFHPERE